MEWRRLRGPVTLALRAQRGNALAERRMGHEQPLQTVLESAGNTERRQLLGQRLGMGPGETLQRRDHLLASRQKGTAGVGAELAIAAEPHHDDAGEYAQHQLGDDSGDPERRAVAALVLAYHPV